MDCAQKQILETKKLVIKFVNTVMLKYLSFLLLEKKKAEDKTVSVRRLGSQNTTVVKLDELINDLKKESLSPIN